MCMGWGLLAAVALHPVYVGLWVSALSLISAMLYVAYKLVQVSRM